MNTTELDLVGFHHLVSKWSEDIWKQLPSRGPAYAFFPLPHLGGFYLDITHTGSSELTLVGYGMDAHVKSGRGIQGLKVLAATAARFAGISEEGPMPEVEWAR
jgi:hypothetical protein